MKQPIPFGKYYLLERVNVGGMAEVFKAKATGVEGFERLVAVKRILPSIAEDEEFITMFVDEAKIAVQLTHANIGQIFDLGRVDGSFFIALEYVHGKDLRAMFNRTRQRGEVLPIPLSCYVIMKLCEGLDYAHNKHDTSGRFLNLVHRDVSPQNILVSYEGEVKIIDFGIAKAAGKAGRTQAGILKGKFGYMSPEQVNGLEIDRRSDVFGVGICLYELLTGERLFVAESDFATLEKVRAVDIMPPSTYNRRIPEELEQIVMRALARDRDVRYQSALQLHDDLQAFMHTSGNLFSRKDLGSYMHRMFASEIEKESARDQELELVQARQEQEQQQAERAPEPLAGAAAPPPPPMLERPKAAAGAPRGAAGGGQERPRTLISGAAQPEIRKRTATLLGVPLATQLRAPSVPRLVPNPQSIPPLNSSRPSLPSRPPPPPSRPPQPMPVPGLTASPAQHAPSAEGMDWDDEELSTQIYDKPEPDHGGAEDGLDALQASVPEAAQPLSPLPPAPATGAAVRASARPAAATTNTPWSGSAQTPTGLALGREPTRATPRPQATTWHREPRGRPMVVAVIAVVAIVASIVLALMVFGEREPGTLNLSTEPDRVAVSVDGRALGVSKSPFVIGELSPGRRHEIVVSSNGYHAWSHSVELSAGQVLTLPPVKLQRVETGFMLSTEPSSALVLVDGMPLAQRTPVRVVDLAPGEHRVRVEHDGFAPWEAVLHATTGTILPLPNVSLQPVAVGVGPSESGGKPSRSWGNSSSERGESSRSDSARGDRTDSSARAEAAARKAEAAAVPAPAPEKLEKPEKAEPTREPEPSAPTPQVAEEDKADKADKPEDKPAADKPSEPSAPVAESGKLRVNSRPWSKVFIDGKPYGNTPRLNIELPVGSHVVKLVNDEYHVEKNIEVRISAGQVESVVVNLLE
mgnify:FL=1